jgi:hypothetical protein
MCLRRVDTASLDEALEAILFRMRAYSAIARLKADPAELTSYQREAHEWAEIGRPRFP